MAEGGFFAIATGRALAAFLNYAAIVPMNAPGVVCNGAAIYDFAANEYLETALLDETARERGQIVLERFPTAAVEAYHLDSVIHGVHCNEITRLHENLTKVPVLEVPALPDVPMPLGKLLFEAKHETLLEIRDFMRAQGWGEDYELIFSTGHLLEMTAKGANKGGMVRRLAQRLGARHIFCAGDEANDLPMLAFAETGFAPENCIPAVRESGATIVRHAKEGAIADVIEILDKQRF